MGCADQFATGANRLGISPKIVVREKATEKLLSLQFTPRMKSLHIDEDVVGGGGEHVHGHGLYDNSRNPEGDKEMEGDK